MPDIKDSPPTPPLRPTTPLPDTLPTPPFPDPQPLGPVPPPPPGPRERPNESSPFVIRLRTRPTPAFLQSWGPYPALVPVKKESDDGNDDSAFGSDGDAEAIVTGFVYNVKSVEHAERLAEYETGHYRATSCRITYTDAGSEWIERDKEGELGYVFEFVGDQDDLNEGAFDLEAWLKRIGRGRGSTAVAVSERNDNGTSAG
ncbi:hypothetical protein BDW74DRAFT_180787 [Aspergillus multicolor]|uniref:uncharacterized protein n=1 Tax=Aspergillus multicolor TaxID=41759 RepID=UPI003CCE1EA8